MDDELDGIVNVTPLARTSINKSHLYTPHQEIFVDVDGYSIKNAKTKVEDDEEIQHIDLGVMNGVWYAVDNESFKEIVKH